MEGLCGLKRPETSECAGLARRMVAVPLIRDVSFEPSELSHGPSRVDDLQAIWEFANEVAEGNQYSGGYPRPSQLARCCSQSGGQTRPSRRGLGSGLPKAGRRDSG